MIKREEMKEGTPFKIAQGEIDKVMSALFDYWDELLKEFNLPEKTYPFIIDRIDSFQEHYYEAFKEWYPAFEKTEEFLKSVGPAIKPSSTMTTSFMGLAKDGKVVQFVYCSLEIIMEKLIIGKNIPAEKGDYIELVIEHLKIALRHEMGHVLHNISLWKSADGDYKKFDDIICEEGKKYKEGYDNLIKEYEGYYMDKMFYKKYHDLPGEAEANLEVGLTWEDHWKWRMITEE